MIMIDNGPEAFGLPGEGELAQLANALWSEGAAASVAAPAPVSPAASVTEFPVASVPEAPVPCSLSSPVTEFPVASVPEAASTPVAVFPAVSAPVDGTTYAAAYPAVSVQEAPQQPAIPHLGDSLHVQPTPQQQDERNTIRVAVRDGRTDAGQDNLYALSDQVNGTHTHRDDGIIVGSKTLQQIRDDFPILKETVGGFPLVWLDNGATTQKPQAVIDRLTQFYTHENSNVHRGAHELAARSTDAYENARQIVADFIGAGDKDDVVFVRGTTEAINLVANAYVKPLLTPGDEIILSILEHHANIVPWQLVAAETGAVLRVIPCDESGQLIMSEYERLFTPRTKFVSVTQVSNVLGTVTPVEELAAIAHRHGVPILIDGAQSVAHMPVNVRTIDADFFVFSGHKIFGPTGIGAVYGKKALLDAARPYHGGGNMIKDVTFERTIYNPAPNKFEAGTGSIADAVGLGEALSYLSAIGMPAVHQWEQELVQYGMKELSTVPGLHLVGTAPGKASALSFKLDGYEDNAVGEYLNRYGIAVRTGHHCAQPVLRRFGLESVVRPTLALYNSPEDIDTLAKALRGLA